MPPPERLLSGNIGRLWLSEIASTLGNLVLGSGVVIWFIQITDRSLIAVALLLASMALPPVLVASFAGTLASRRDPRRLLSVLGVLRVTLAFLFVLMHFNTVIPITLLLAFGLSLATSMRDALRRAAIAHGVPVRARSLLASGDQVAVGVLSVAGPALATLLYVLNGERILTIAIGASVCYFLAFVGESQVGPLPDKFLYQRPVNDVPAAKNESVWEGDEDDEEDAQVIAAEHKTPVWELVAPPDRRSASADISAGLRLAGTSSHALIAVLLTALLALLGGTLAVIEPFYVWLDLRQVPYILGLLFVASGLGAAIASALVVEIRSFGRFFLVIGTLGSAAGLYMLPRTTDITHGLIAIAILGAANVLAIRGGQMTIFRHFVPVEQRAVAAMLSVLRPTMSLFGILAALALLQGFSAIQPTGVNNLLVISALAALLCGVVGAVFVVLPNWRTAEAVATLEDDEWDESTDDSRYLPRAGGADDSGRYPAYSDEYETPRGDGHYDDDEDDDAPPPTRGSRGYADPGRDPRRR